VGGHNESRSVSALARLPLTIYAAGGSNTLSKQLCHDNGPASLVQRTAGNCRQHGSLMFVVAGVRT
jgi:hypothetical protein